MRFLRNLLSILVPCSALVCYGIATYALIDLREESHMSVECCSEEQEKTVPCTDVSATWDSVRFTPDSR